MNSNWSNGYVADITYSHGYYHELAPSCLRFALLLNGLGNGAGDPATGTYTYCELGYGQGVSANLHAAANPRGRFWGTDFNPDHALFARNLAQQAGIQAEWLAASFEDLLEADLPPFDFITLHGVWSWVHSAARHAIVEFMRRRLKVGGVVYISYNVMPGWSAEKPLRDLMWLHTELAEHDAPQQGEIGALVSFWNIEHGEFQGCSLSILLDRYLEGRGLMYALTEPAVREVMARHRLHRVMATHLPENLRSARLLRRLGFAVEGYARDFLQINGRWRDTVLLSRLVD